MERIKRLWAAVKLPLSNALIGLLLALILIDAMPFSPPLLREKIAPLLNCLGLKQGEWTMFGPNPDARNERLSAEIEYADGSRATWHSPDWRSENPLGRFARSRRLEYLDNITYLAPRPVTVEEYLEQQQGIESAAVTRAKAAWDGLADFACREIAPSETRSPVARVRIYKELAEVLDPEETGWIPIATPPEYGEPTLLHERRYP